jgi:hypothetical protein
MGHHVVGTAAGPDVSLLRHLQGVEGAGRLRPQPEHSPVQVLPAGACGEHGVAVLAGGAVQTAEVLIKGQGGVGIVGPGDRIDQLGQQGAGTGQQDVDGLHGSFPYVSPRQRGKSIIYIRNQYSISKVPLPLKRFFWPKYCKKGQKKQPKAVFRALGCFFS